MRAYVMKNTGSSNNLPCYPPDSHQRDNAVYSRTGVSKNSQSPIQVLTGLPCTVLTWWPKIMSNKLICKINHYEPDST